MSNRRLAWTYICQFGTKKFTVAEVAKGTGMTTNSAKYFISKLLKAQRLEVIGEYKSMMINEYRVIDSTPLPCVGPWRAKRPKVMQRLWNTCRIMKKFSYLELRATAQVGEKNARIFVSALVKSRILRKVETPDGVLYRLNKDLGPLHPEIMSLGIRCQNSRTYYPFKERQ